MLNDWIIVRIIRNSLESRHYTSHPIRRIQANYMYMKVEFVPMFLEKLLETVYNKQQTMEDRHQMIIEAHMNLQDRWSKNDTCKITFWWVSTKKSRDPLVYSLLLFVKNDVSMTTDVSRTYLDKL